MLFGWEKLERIPRRRIKISFNHAELAQLLVQSSPPCRIHLSNLRPARIFARDESPSPQFLPREPHPFGTERWIQFGYGGVRCRWVQQIIAPTAQRSAYESCHRLGMLPQKILRGEHHTVRCIARFTDQQHTRFNSGPARKERLGCRKSLLNVIWIGNEIGHAHGSRNFTQVPELIALRQISKPRRSSLHGNGMPV